MPYSVLIRERHDLDSTGQELGTLRGHTAEVIALHYNDDGNQIISGSFDGTVNIWDTRIFEWVFCLLTYSRINSSLSICNFIRYAQVNLFSWFCPFSLPSLPERSFGALALLFLVFYILLIDHRRGALCKYLRYFLASLVHRKKSVSRINIFEL